MNWKLVTAGLTLALGAGFMTNVLAQAKPEVLVQQRQAAMTLQLKYLGPLFGMAQGKVPFNAEIVARNAGYLNVLDKMAWDGFAESTKGTSAKTRALPAIWTEADRFKEAIDLIEKPVPVVILRIRHVPAIDATGLHMIKEFLHELRKDSTTLILSGVHTQPLFAMERSGLWDEVGEENIFGNIDDALNRAREILGLPKAPRPVPFVPVVERERDNDKK